MARIDQTLDLLPVRTVRRDEELELAPATGPLLPRRRPARRADQND